MREVATHTPPPWRLSKSALVVLAGDDDPGAGFPGGRVVALTLPPDYKLATRRANAAFIVRAVNAHAGLLAACEAAHAVLLALPWGVYDVRPRDEWPAYLNAVELARAAIAAARGA
jgi:hypothetical protein